MGARSRQERLEQRQGKRSSSNALIDQDEGSPFLSSDKGVIAAANDDGKAMEDFSSGRGLAVSVDPCICGDRDTYPSQTSRVLSALDEQALGDVDGIDADEGEGEERAQRRARGLRRAAAPAEDDQASLSKERNYASNVGFKALSRKFAFA